MANLSTETVTIVLDAKDLTSAAFKKVNASIKNVDSSLGQLQKSFFSVKNAITAAVAVSGLTKFAELADTFNSVNARLKLVSRSTQDFASAQSSLLDISQKTRTSYAETVDLFATFTRSTKDLNVTQDELLKLTTGINQALAVSGSSGPSAAAALVQLGQGFAAGALRGQEFLSVAEQAPYILDVLSKGLGVTRGELKKMADEGQITTSTFINGFMAGSKDLQKEYESLPITIQGATQKISNSLLFLVGSLDKVTSASKRVADAFSFLSQIIDFTGQQFDKMAKIQPMAELASELIAAEKELKKYNWMLDKAKGSGFDYSETTKRQAEAQERFNRALYAFRGAEFSGQMAPPLAFIPKKPKVSLTKDQQKEADKQTKLNELYVSQMTDIEKQARYGAATMYRLADANKANAKATTDAYVAARNLRQNVGLAEMSAILDVINAQKTPLEQFKEGIKSVDEAMQNMAVGGIQRIEDALTGVLMGTVKTKDAFRSMALSIIADIIRMNIQQSVTKPLAGIISGLFSSGISLNNTGAYSASAWEASQKAFGMKAIGGSVQSGKPYMVGERGPEMFVPNQSGSIVSNNKLGGSGGVTIVQNINVSTGVQQTVRAEVMSLMPQIAGAAKAAVADAKLRGGSYAAALR